MAVSSYAKARSSLPGKLQNSIFQRRTAHLRHARSCRNKAVQEGSILKGKVEEIFINGKNAIVVLDTDECETHIVVRSIAYLLPQVEQKRL